MSDDEEQEDKFIQICNRLIHNKLAMNDTTNIMNIIEQALRLMDKSHFTKQFQNDYSKIINTNTTKLPYQFSQLYRKYAKNKRFVKYLRLIYNSFETGNFYPDSSSIIANHGGIIRKMYKYETDNFHHIMTNNQYSEKDKQLYILATTNLAKLLMSKSFNIRQNEL